MLQFCIGHLAGDGTLPDEVVEAALLLIAFDCLLIHIGGTDGLVSLLSAFRTGVVLTRLDVILAHLLSDDSLAGTQAELAQVHTVRTHVCDATALVEVLGNHHCLSHGEAELVSCFLLQSAGGEWRSRCALHGLRLDVLNGELAVLHALEESLRLVDGSETTAQHSLHLAAVGIEEECRHTIVLLALEVLYLALTLYNQTHGHTLHATSRETWLHLAPEHRTELEAHDAVQHATSLLSIHQVEVNLTRMLNGIQDGRLCNLVEDDTTRVLGLQSEHLVKVPADGLSLAVFIGSQPHHPCLVGLTLQLGHHLLLVGRHLILWRERLLVHAERALLQVANVSVAGQHLVIITQELLDGLSLCRALHNHQIIFHV